MMTTLNLVNNQNIVLVGKYKLDALMKRLNISLSNLDTGLFRDGDEMIAMLSKYFTLQEITNGKLLNITSKVYFTPVIEYEKNGKMNFINIIVLKSNVVK